MVGGMNVANYSVAGSDGVREWPCAYVVTARSKGLAAAVGEPCTDHSAAGPKSDLGIFLRDREAATG